MQSTPFRLLYEVFFSIETRSILCMRKHTIICKEEKEKKKESKKHYLYVSAMEVTTFVFLCRSLLATSVKALRLREKKDANDEAVPHSLGGQGSKERAWFP